MYAIQLPAVGFLLLANIINKHKHVLVSYFYNL